MPALTAVSSNAQQLYQLLRCVSFKSTAQVQISADGLRFSVEDSRVIQGLVFLGKELFTTYRFEAINIENTIDTSSSQGSPVFQINLTALLETLQIFGFADAKTRITSRDSAFSGGIDAVHARTGAAFAFDNRTLGMTGSCRITYGGTGDPLCITLEESNVTTTCELTTYETDLVGDIPFDRDHLVQKIIMKAQWLHDAVAELTSTSPDRVTLATSPSKPYFALSAAGPLGSASVEFSKDAQLLETFQVGGRVVNSYKFSMLKAAVPAMSIASKVSIRGDDQGVLSLQFMVDAEDGTVSFVDFRFVPFIAEDEDEDGDGAGSQ